jgi:hypothetical protein
MKLFIAAALIAAAAVALSAPPQTNPHAIAAPPMNFVGALNCVDTNAAATFIIPSRAQLVEQFGAAPEQVWIDISLFNNNFAPSTFLGTGPLRGLSLASFYQWSGLQNAGVHYYRLNAFVGGRWREVGRGVFEPLNCGFITRMTCGFGDDVNFSMDFGVPPAPPLTRRMALEQWIDLTLFASPRNPTLDNGFPRGTFVSAGPFPASGGHFTWQGIRPGLRHFYRVNTLYSTPVGTEWIVQFSGSFLTLDCTNLPRRP